jgi:ligand-binding SRPBCC domain-containing protein
MKIYHFTRTQRIPIGLQSAWKFFSSPANLAIITPPAMNFRILHNSGTGEMYAGQIIQYRIMVLPMITTTWVTEITQVKAPVYFIDEQRYGPYSMWHHQHHFKEVSGGVEMTDEINYAIPFGVIGQMANALFVRRQLNAIFDFRFQAIQNHFSKTKELS